MKKISLLILIAFESVIASPVAGQLKSYVPTNWVVSCHSNIALVLPPPADGAVRFRPDRVLSSSNAPVLFPSDKPIKFGFLSLDNSTYQLAILAPKYGCKVSVSDRGEVVPKTRLGDAYGQGWEMVKVWKRSQFDHSGTGERPYWTAARPDLPVISRELPAPDRLFRFPKSGQYVVRVELQVWCWPYRSSSTNAVLVSLPAFAIHVVRP